ncbi:MAG: hypothetical protein FWE01_02755 [Firmicutes bacterium]|nr:hypothetical protein [Bacillota bacterium]
MGKIIKFAQKRAYKITIICLAVFAAIFIMVGGIIAGTNSTSTPSFLAVNVPGASRAADGAWLVDVYNRTTPIQINTWDRNGMPNRTELPIRLLVQSGNELVNITPSIRTGGVAMLTLRNNYERGEDRGIPFFHDDRIHSDTRISVNIVVGGLIERLHIRIRLSQVQFSTRLERNTGGNNWIPIDALDQTNIALPGQPQRTIMQEFLDPNTTHNFRINSTFRVFNSVVFSTLNVTERQQFTIDWDHERLHFDEEDITLVPQIVIRNPSIIQSTGTYTFEISVLFMGQTFRDFFDLRIVI